MAHDTHTTGQERRRALPLLTGVLVAVILCISACAPATPTGGLTEAEAIEAARRIAAESRPEMSGSQIAVDNIHAERMRFVEAVARLSDETRLVAMTDPGLAVWLVTLDGEWLDEFPRPTDAPTPEPYRHMTIILDAQTGHEITSSARP